MHHPTIAQSRNSTSSKALSHPVRNRLRTLFGIGTLTACLVPGAVLADGPGISQAALDFTGSALVPGDLVRTNFDVSPGTVKGATISDFQYGYLFTRTRTGGYGRFWDISNPANPVLAASTEIGGDKQHSVGFWMGSTGQKYFTGGTNGDLARIYELGTGSVSSRGSIGSNGLYPIWVFVQAPYLYRFNTGYLSNPSRMNVYDATDPNNVTMLTRPENDTSDPRPHIDIGSDDIGFTVGAHFVVGNLLIAAPGGGNGRGLATFDVSNPLNPVKLMSTTEGTESYSGIVSGTRAFNTDGSGKMGVYDFRDPRDIRYVGGALVRSKYCTFKDKLIYTNAAGLQASRRFYQVFRDNLNTYEANQFALETEFVYPVGNLAVGTYDDGSIMLTNKEADKLGPVVDFVSPTPNSVNQALTSRIGMIMSDQMDVRALNTSTFIVRPVGGTAIAGTYSTQMGIINFCPAQPLQPNTTYEVLLPRGQMKDNIGNTLEGDFRMLFSTGASIQSAGLNMPPEVKIFEADNTWLGQPINIETAVTDENMTGMNLQWSEVWGPGTVAFSSTTANGTTATFSEAGTYLLQLKATDGGNLRGSDIVYVKVKSSAPRRAITAGSIVRGMDWALYTTETDHKKLGPVITSTKTPTQTGVTELSTSPVPAPADKSCLRFSGYLDIPVTGNYKFELTSGPGTVWIGSSNTDIVFDYTGHFEFSQTSGSIFLEKGKHKFTAAWRRELSEDTVDINWVTPLHGDTALIGSPNLFRNNPNPTDTPPVASFTGSSLDGPAPLTVTFNGSGSTDNNSVASHEWDFDYLGDKATGQTTAFTYNVPGVYRVKMFATDGNGGMSETTRRVIVRRASSTPASGPVIASASSAQAIAVTGSNVNMTTNATGAIDYRWNFGDGITSAWQGGNSISHTYTKPGRYTVTASARNAGGTTTTSFVVRVHYPLTASKPNQSGQIIYETRTGTDRIWNVNPDNDTVTVLAADTLAKVAEIAVGKNPRSLALAGNGLVWVACEDSDQIQVISTSTLAVSQILSPGYGTAPASVVASPNGQSMFISFAGTGAIARFNQSNYASTGTVLLSGSTKPEPRALAVSADSTRLFAARFISDAFEGLIWEMNATTGTFATQTPAIVSLQYDGVSSATASSAPGVPNYLMQIAISPDGRQAWIPSKEDNSGLGAQLTFETTVRAIVSKVSLTSAPAQEIFSTTSSVRGREDIDNRELPASVAFSSIGDIAFVAFQGNNSIDAIDTATGNNIAGVNNQSGGANAPQSLVLSPDGNVLYAHNYMSRTVSAYNVSGLLDGTSSNFTVLTGSPANTVATEKLAGSVLTGKKVFYNAADPRMSQDGYISCATCHLDGGQDGQVWDFTSRGEGLRNTTDLRGRAGMAHGNVHWTGNFDEIQDFILDITNQFNGSGFLPAGQDPHPPLGAPNGGRDSNLDALADYVTSLQTVGKSPYRTAAGQLGIEAVAGRKLFFGTVIPSTGTPLNCASCHSGTNFSDSIVSSTNPVFHNVGTTNVNSGKRLGQTLNGLIDTPTLRGLWGGAPFLHDGSATTLYDVINNPAHGNASGLTTVEKTQLVNYLFQIDDAEQPGVLAGENLLENSGFEQPGAVTAMGANQTSEVPGWFNTGTSTSLVDTRNWNPDQGSWHASVFSGGWGTRSFAQTTSHVIASGDTFTLRFRHNIREAYNPDIAARLYYVSNGTRVVFHSWVDGYNWYANRVAGGANVQPWRTYQATGIVPPADAIGKPIGIQFTNNVFAGYVLVDEIELIDEN